MAQRVVTADIVSMIGVPVRAVVGVHYRDTVGTPAALRGGCYLDVIATLPAGTVSATELHPNLYDAILDGPDRIRRADDGPLHVILGIPTREVPLDPGDPSDAAIISTRRTAVCAFDLGAHLLSRVDAVRKLPVVGGVYAWELLIDSASDVSNRPTEHIYDTLDFHPRALRAVVEAGDHVRRESASDPPPGWDERKPQERS